LADLPGNEVGVLLDLKTDNTFPEYFLFQYSDPIFDVSKARNLTFVSATSDMVKFKDLSKTYTFTIDPNYRNSSETIYYGYGLSDKKANYTLVIPPGPILTLMDAVMFNRALVGDITCHSGGVGSTECSISSSPITGGGGCSTKCGQGYYACCDDTKNECRCKANPIKKKNLVISPN
jgi:hypothetical protein